MPTTAHSRTLSFQASHPSIGPASTPDVQTSRPPFRSEDLSAALSSPDLRSRRPKPTKQQQECDREEKEKLVDREMLLWGWGMLVGSTTCFVLGVWSIAVGPFIDTEGVWVSSIACQAGKARTDLLGVAAGRAREGHALQVPPGLPGARHALRGYYKLVGIEGELRWSFFVRAKLMNAVRSSDTPELVSMQTLVSSGSCTHMRE